MPRFRKRPVEVAAQRWDGTAEAATPIIDWILREGGTARYREATEAWESADGQQGRPAEPAALLIDTRDGTMAAAPGDWIIREPVPTQDRRFYPCKPAIFDATYEPVGSSR